MLTVARSSNSEEKQRQEGARSGRKPITIRNTSMSEKFVVREIEPGRWVLDYKTAMGTSSGYTTFPTSDAAVAAAKDRDNTVEIEIRPLAN
jgi:hypothetical protein